MTADRSHETGSGTRPERAWEERAREILADSDHDPELGLLVARDARRVVAGELDEEEFRRRHHDVYLEEFGCDDRPRLTAGGHTSGSEPEVRATGAEQGDAAESPAGAAADASSGPPTVISRRALLTTVGGAAAGALVVGDLFRRGMLGATRVEGVAQAAVSSGAETNGRARVQFGMVIDLERCDGCLTCVAACREENGLADGVLWPYVFTYREPGDLDPRYLVRVCQNCTRAPCVMVCPTGARHRRSYDGIVLSDYDVCIGCRYCQAACPYGVNYFQWGDPATYGGSYEGERYDARRRAVVGDPPKGVMGKCTYCPLRQDDPERRGTAACADACPMDAIHIGDLNDPDSAPRRYLAQRMAENDGNLPTFRLLEELGTQPNVIYIGQPPSVRAEPIEGDWTYEDWGIVEDRRAVLEPPDHWFRRVAGGQA
jgi:Fe-S-cluster-containing dehydrogenase component